jgi:exodeoxyribonuclease V alpha subunit
MTTTAQAFLAQLKAMGGGSHSGGFSRLDTAMAQFILSLDTQAQPALVMLVAALTRLQGQGHSCLPLAPFAKQPLAVLGLSPTVQEALAGLWEQLPNNLPGWLEALEQSPCVALAHNGNKPGHQPLVLDGPLNQPRLYLRRSWQHEQRVVGQLHQRLAQPLACDEALAKSWLQALFDEDAAAASASPINWQKLACAAALRGRVTIITGGPGTGKTYAAARVLALVMGLADQAKPLRVAMAAPTGKAAARLKEAMDKALKTLAPRLPQPLNVDALARQMGPALTLHALLGARPDTHSFRYNTRQPLPLDLLVVDEASMVDLEMMSSLLDALPPMARLVLLGDKDQLASVEAGAVFADLCHGADQPRYDTSFKEFAQRVANVYLPHDEAVRSEPASLLAQHTVMLRVSHRFSGPIGQLALAVNAGNAVAAERVLKEAAQGTGQALLNLQGASINALWPLVTAPEGETGRASFRNYLSRIQQGSSNESQQAHQQWVSDVLLQLDRCRVLCAVREGEWGSQGVNLGVERALQAQGLIQAKGQWYVGRPVLVTRNLPALRLLNGDLGVVLPAWSEGGGGGLKVYFAGGDAPRAVAVSRITHADTAFAMTVHKSQGSEYEHVVLVLPARASNTLGRELVYTGITRARQHFSLLTQTADLLGKAIGQTTYRASGLKDLL